MTTPELVKITKKSKAIKFDKKVDQPIKKIKIVAKKKPVDPTKVNAAAVLARIAFTQVDDRFLMNANDIEKDELLKSFVGFDNPTTCQLNLNYLYCKAISNLERRMNLVEKQLKAVCSHPLMEGVNKPVVSGNKRKRDEKQVTGTSDIVVATETINLDAEVTQDGFQSSSITEEKKDEACNIDGRKEEGEVSMHDA